MAARHVNVLPKSAKVGLLICKVLGILFSGREQEDRRRLPRVGSFRKAVDEVVIREKREDNEDICGENIQVFLLSSY